MSATLERQRIPCDLIRSQDGLSLCGFYAIQNLYVSYGLESPPVKAMLEFTGKQYTTSPEHMGLTVVELFGLLGVLQFPHPIALGSLGPFQEAINVFPALVDAGCGLLI